MNKPLILYIFGNHKERYLGDLVQEGYHLKKLVKPTLDEYKIEVDFIEYSKDVDIVDLINVNLDRLIIFHFSGHTNQNKSSLDLGSIFIEGLRKKLAKCSALKLVFLNGCMNSNQVNSLAESSSFSVIGTTTLVSDKVAADFSIQFYKGLINQKLSIETAFKRAFEDVETMHDTVGDRSLGLDTNALGKNIWYLEKPEISWRLEFVVDFSNKIPPLADSVLPDKPFIGIESYAERDVGIFFGRSRDIFNVLEILKSDAEKLLIIHGDTGVGKSSFLSAGLIPRIRVKSSSLLFFKNPACFFESKICIDNIDYLVIDHFEHLMRDPSSEKLISDVFFLNNKNKNIKIIIGIRTEWYGTLENHIYNELGAHKISYMLKPLEFVSVKEIISYPVSSDKAQRKYNLSYSSNSLIERISRDVLLDKSSNIAPSLQFILLSLWEKAKKEHHPGAQIIITEEMYHDLFKKGILLEDFVNENILLLEKGCSWNVNPVKSGLVLEVLKEFAVDVNFSNTVSSKYMKEKYGHIFDFNQLMESLVDHHLLSGEGIPEDGVYREFRLSHDSIALVVNTLYSESFFPAQQFLRTLKPKYQSWSGSNSDQYYLSNSEIDFFDAKAIRGLGIFENDIIGYIDKSRIFLKKYKMYTIYVNLVMFIFVGLLGLAFLLNMWRNIW